MGLGLHIPHDTDPFAINKHRRAPRITCRNVCDLRNKYMKPTPLRLKKEKVVTDFGALYTTKAS